MTKEDFLDEPADFSLVLGGPLFQLYADQDSFLTSGKVALL